MALRNVTWTVNSTGDEPMSGSVYVRSTAPHQSIVKTVSMVGGRMTTILSDNTRYLFSIDLYDTSGNAHDSNGTAFIVDVPSGTGTYSVVPTDVYRVIDGRLNYYPSAYGMTNRQDIFYG